jgi:hypothetical protein
MIFRIRWLLCVLTAAAALGVAGCESNNDKVEDEDLEKIARRERNQRERERERDLDDPDPVIAREPDRDGDRNSDRRGMSEIPREAVAVEGGEGVGLRYEPARDGTIYVYDIDADRVVYVGRLQSKERFVLDPSGNRATVDGKTVFRSDLNPRNRYRLYFDRTGR